MRYFVILVEIVKKYHLLLMKILIISMLIVIPVLNVQFVEMFCVKYKIQINCKHIVL